MPLHLQQDICHNHCKEDLNLQQEISCDIFEDTLATTSTIPIPLHLPLPTQTLYLSKYYDDAVIYHASIPPPPYR
jgi:hypothetical protein